MNNKTDKYSQMRSFNEATSKYYRARFIERTKELCIFDDNYIPSYDNSQIESREVRVLKLSNFATELLKYGFTL